MEILKGLTQVHLVDFTEYLTLRCKAPKQENSVAPAMVVQ